MTTTQEKQSFGDSIKTAIVTVADMKAALDAVDNLPEEDRKDFTGRTIAIMRAFGLLRQTQRKNFTDSDRERIAKATAVQIRIEAMARLAEHPKFNAWSRESGIDDGMVLIREDMLRAAAEAPLYDEQGKGSYFDPDEFFTLLLALAHLCHYDRKLFAVFSEL
jgi:hypothetical protein